MKFVFMIIVVIGFMLYLLSIQNRTLLKLNKAIVSIIFSFIITITFFNIMDIFKPRISLDKESISITALNSMNKQAQGNEIRLKKVYIDGNLYSPEIVNGKWIEQENFLSWKAYDKPYEITDKIEISVPKGNDRKLIFEKNMWRGKVLINDGNSEKIIDCYANNQGYDENIDVKLSSDMPDNLKYFYNIKYLISLIIFIFIYFTGINILSIDEKRNNYLSKFSNMLSAIKNNINNATVGFINSMKVFVQSSKGKKYLIYYLLFSIITIVFITSFIYREDPLYIWDYGHYQQKYSDLGQLLHSQDFKAFFHRFYGELKADDYNSTSIILLLPFYFLYGASRVGYISGIGLVYCVPTIFLLVYIIFNTLLRNVVIDNKRQCIKYIFILCSTFVYIWGPVMIGFSDIIGLIPLAIAYYIMIKTKNFDLNKKQSLLIGLMLYMSFMFRRWYAFGAVAFYVSSTIIIFYDLLKKEINFKKAIQILLKLLVSGIVIILLCFVVQPKLTTTILSINYGSEYKAYQLNSVSEHIKAFIGYFGWISISICGLGILFGIIRKKFRRLALYMTISLFISFFVFIKTQKFSWQHNYLLTIQFLILSSILIISFEELIKKKYLRQVSLICICILSIINFAFTFCIREEPLVLAMFTPQNKYLPLHKEAMGELKQLVNSIDQLVKENGSSKWASFTTGWNLNDALIDVVGNSNEFKNAYIPVSHIDETHKLKLEPLSARYVVVTDKVVYQQQPESQRVISIPNNEIFNGIGIGKAYKCISRPFEFENGTKAYIYEKQRDFSKDEIEAFLDEFYKFYPEWSKLYTIEDAMKKVN